MGEINLALGEEIISSFRLQTSSLGPLPQVQPAGSYYLNCESQLRGSIHPETRQPTKGKKKEEIKIEVTPKRSLKKECADEQFWEGKLTGDH